MEEDRVMTTQGPGQGLQEPRGKRAEVLRYLQQGLAARDIARKMKVTTKAVYAHRTRLIKSGFWSEKQEQEAKIARDFQRQPSAALEVEKTQIVQNSLSDQSGKEEPVPVANFGEMEKAVVQVFERAKNADKLRNAILEAATVLEDVLRKLRDAVG